MAPEDGKAKPSGLPGTRLETPEERQKRLEPLIAVRMRKREEWDAYWKIFDLETRGRVARLRYWFWRGVDIPATWWQENVLEPLQDKHGRWPYYHRRFKRVPTIDECHVNDVVCYHEAQQQYFLDKLVDNKILQLLQNRFRECLNYNNGVMKNCLQQMEDVEETELNWFIKYGELAERGDVLFCYMKQKHRMIWERRNPEIMAERQKAYVEHKRLLNMGVYDHWFWKRRAYFNFQDYRGSDLRYDNIQPYTIGRIRDPEAVSLDPEYFRQRKEAEESGKFKQASPFEVYP